MLLSFFFVITPITAFIITILVIVFLNLVDLNYCPPSELCPYAAAAGTNSTNYYVNYPVDTGYGVSTLCTGVPQYSCHRNELSNRTLVHCPADAPYKNVTILVRFEEPRTWSLGWNKHMFEMNPFDPDDPNSRVVLSENGFEDTIQNLTLEDGNSIFRNLWH